MELRAVRYEAADGVAVVTLDRPDRLNAWTVRMERELRWAMVTADGDPAVQVIVLTGAGRGFCAGADMQAIAKMAEGRPYGEDGRNDPDLDELRAVAWPPAGVAADFQHGFSWLAGLSKPVVAAVNGPAAGVGFVLMCFADVRFAAAGAKLTTSFARLGLPAEHGVSWALTRLVGAGRAADLLLSSRVMLAEEAAEMGLVSKVLPAGELLPFTLDYARAMAAECSPSSLRTIKRQLWDDLVGGLDAAATFAEGAMARMLSEPDFIEGATAQREGRGPSFSST